MEVSKDVIKHNKERYQKEIIAFNENQGKIELKKPFNESEEANIIALKIEESKRLGNKYSDTAILYRTNITVGFCQKLGYTRFRGIKFWR